MTTSAFWQSLSGFSTWFVLHVYKMGTLEWLDGQARDEQRNTMDTGWQMCAAVLLGWSQKRSRFACQHAVILLARPVSVSRSRPITATHAPWLMRQRKWCHRVLISLHRKCIYGSGEENDGGADGFEIFTGRDNENIYCQLAALSQICSPGVMITIILSIAFEITKRHSALIRWHTVANLHPPEATIQRHDNDMTTQRHHNDNTTTSQQHHNSFKTTIHTVRLLADRT